MKNLAQHSHLQTSANPARSMLFDHYNSTTRFAAEMKSCFRSGWIAIGHASDVPAVGDAKPITIAEMNVVLVRSSVSEVTVLRNVSSWDGTPILTGTVRGASGFTGTYHGWQWNLEGKLVATPYARGSFDDAPTSPGLHDLTAVRSSLWADLVFVNLSGTAASLEESLGPLLNRMAEFKLECLVPALERSGSPIRLKRTIRANWKLCFENDIDVYHEAFVHRSYRDSPYSPKVHDGVRTYEPVSDGVLFGLTAPLAQYFTEEEFAGLPPIQSTNPHDCIQIFDVFPNAQVSMFGNHLVLGVFRPVSAEVTELEVGFYVDPTIAAEHEIGDLVLAGWSEARDEDIAIVELTQKGRGQLPTASYVANEFWDTATSDFHEMVNARTSLEGPA